jgi:hypothetical protein
MTGWVESEIKKVWNEIRLKFYADRAAICALTREEVKGRRKRGEGLN